MNSDMAVGTLMGFVAGALLMLLAMKSFVRHISTQVRSYQDEDDRRDPANWWKYGKAQNEFDDEE